MKTWTNAIYTSIESPLGKGNFDADSLLSHIEHHNGDEAYHLLFDLEPRDTYKGYKGLSRPASGWFVLDFDSSASNEIAKAEMLIVYDKLKLSNNFARIFYSGSKGFHLYIREEAFGIPHTDQTHRAYGAVAASIASNLSIETLDTSIYQANRKFRLPMSRHPKTNLYKIELNIDEARGLSMDEIRDKAKDNSNSRCTLQLWYAPLPYLKHFVNQKLSEPRQSFDEPTKNTGPVPFGMENLLEEVNPFKVYRNKPCISSLLTKQLKEGERHEACVAIVADLYHLGETREKIESTIVEWASRNDVSGRLEEFQRVISDQYKSPTTTISCYSEIKKRHCALACGLYSMLDKDKRALSPSVTVEVETKEATLNVHDDEDITSILNNDEPLDEELKKPAKKEGKKKDVNWELIVTQKIFSEYKDRILKERDDIFVYNGTYWDALEGDACKDIFRRKIDSVTRGSYSINDIDKIYRRLMIYVPTTPVGRGFYQPSPNLVNFKNGTLRLTRDKSGEYRLTFGAHSKDDLLTSCLPFNYSSDLKSNPLLTKTLDEMLEGDEEKSDKLRAIKQMAAAMLMPAFPRLFFLVGKAGTRKSTLLLTFYNAFGGKRYFSTVDPTVMHKDFMTESMINKTANIVTDVNESGVFTDHVMKSVEDRSPRQVNRKQIKAVEATLPAVHVFGCNSLPATNTKNESVYDRRVTAIKLNKVLASQESGHYTRSYETVIIEKGGVEGILSFALEGLQDLIASDGLYFQPTSGSQHTKEWQKEAGGITAQFLQAIEAGGVVSQATAENPESMILGLGDDLKVPRRDLWEAFKMWCVDSGFGEFQMPVKKYEFYRHVARSYAVWKSSGHWYVKGIGAVSKAENSGGF